MMQIRSKLRQPALYVAGLSVLFLLLVAACGGGTETTKAPLPWPLQRLKPPRPQQLSPRWNPPQQSPSKEGPSSGSETLFITANETGTITVELTAGDILELSFDVVSSITGGRMSAPASARPPKVSS